MTFSIARTLDDAFRAMQLGARPVAGGSDLVVAARQTGSPLPEHLVAIDRIGEICQIETHPNGLAIGAGVTHAELVAAPVIVDDYSALADASALVGSPATRNVGTLGGNVMNASPAMDTGAPLVVLGAFVELRTVDSARELAITDLWTGPGATSAGAEELCTSIRLPTPQPHRGSAYVRLEYRRAMEIAVVGAAARVDLDGDGRVVDAALALTAVAPTIVTIDAVGDLLRGATLDDASLGAVAQAASQGSAPISDLRASDSYRRHTVGVMARRAVDAAARRARGESISVPVNRAFGIGAAV